MYISRLIPASFVLFCSCSAMADWSIPSTQDFGYQQQTYSDYSRPPQRVTTNYSKLSGARYYSGEDDRSNPWKDSSWEQKVHVQPVANPLSGFSTITPWVAVKSTTLPTPSYRTKKLSSNPWSAPVRTANPNQQRPQLTNTVWSATMGQARYVTSDVLATLERQQSKNSFYYDDYMNSGYMSESADDYVGNYSNKSIWSEDFYSDDSRNYDRGRSYDRSGNNDFSYSYQPNDITSSEVLLNGGGFPGMPTAALGGLAPMNYSEPLPRVLSGYNYNSKSVDPFDLGPYSDFNR